MNERRIYDIYTLNSMQLALIFSSILVNIVAIATITNFEGAAWINILLMGFCGVMVFGNCYIVRKIKYDSVNV